METVGTAPRPCTGILAIPRARSNWPWREKMSAPIHVWPFEDAPKRFQRLSRNGGDEDWIAVVPADYTGPFIGWAEEGTPFGWCDVQRFDLRDGRTVYIGSHS